MPYSSKADLPDNVKKMPAHQQDAFMAAFNAADERGEDEETCFKIAYAAMKRAGTKGGEMEKKDMPAKSKGMSEEGGEGATMISRDPFVFWSDDEVNSLTALHAAEVRKDNGKPYSWHPLVPVGEFHHPKFGKLAFTSDDVADFAANFRAGVRGSDIPVDELGAHESTPHGAAYGWLEDVEVKADGLWGRIGWNKSGQEVLAEDEFRYISPTLHTRDLPFTAKDGSKVGNVVKSICLTNRPVFKGQPALTVNMAEYEEVETGAEPQDAAATDADTIDKGATQGRSDAMITDGTKELAAAQAAEATATQAVVEPDAEGVAAAAAEPAVDVAALTAERDGLLVEVQSLKDTIAGLEQATVAAAEGNAEAQVDTAEPPSPEAVKLAEVERELQSIRDERALELAERQYREIELGGSKRLGKADVELYAKVHRALPSELAAQLAEHVAGGGPTFVQFGELGLSGGGAAGSKPADGRKLYEEAVKADPDAALTEQTVTAVVKFGEGKQFANFDALYAAWHEDGKPGLK